MKKRSFKLNNKIIIAVNLFLIFTLMTVSVYSWFAANVDNRVSTYEIEVQSNEALELSFDKDTWSGTLNLADYKLPTNPDTYLLNNLKFVEVTGDGVNFYKPQLIQHSNYAEVDTVSDFPSADVNKDYIEFTVNMRSKEAVNVYLSSDSKATPSSNVLQGADCGNPCNSAYASDDKKFSKDCVVGALRTSFVNKDGDRYIWITNPEFHLKNDVGSDTYEMEINDPPKAEANGSGAYAWNNPLEHKYYNGDKKLSTFTNTLFSLPDTVSKVPGDKTKVASLNRKSTKDASGYYHDSATFTIWLEGCDTEARKALISGKFTLSLVFDAFPTAEE